MRTAQLVYGLALLSLSLVACGGNQGSYRATSSVGSAGGSQKVLVEAPELDPLEDMGQVDETPVAAPAPVATQTPKTPVPAAAPKVAESPKSIAKSTIDQSNLPAARKAQMNASVENLLSAVESGNQQSINAAERQLLTTAIGQSVGIGGFGLVGAAAVDIAAIIDAIKDLIAAAIAADLAGIAAAIQDLIGA